MNAKQFEKYKQAVEFNLRGLSFVSTGACPGCDECGLGERVCPACDGQKFDVEKPEPLPGEPETICPRCNGIGEIDSTERERELAEEPGFSWSECDACGSTLGGDRHPAHGRDKDNAILHLSVCSDCVYFLNYGQLDDMSMAEIESNKP